MSGGKMAAKLDDYLRFNETALNLRAQRQQLLASNIANADTPHYKARDIDFAQTLAGAMGGQSGSVRSLEPVALARTVAGHLAGLRQGGDSIGVFPLLYRGVMQGSVDGNSVDMDVERNQFTDNGLHYEANITAVNMQIKSLLNAIQPG